MIDAPQVSIARGQDLKRFGARLRSLRLARGLSQEQLAEAASLSRDGIARLELGDRWPRFDTVIKLADALELPIASLLEQHGDDDASLERLRHVAADLPEGDIRLLIGIASLLKRDARRRTS